MADNIQLNAGTGGDILAATDASGAKHQKALLETNVAGTPTVVSSTNPVPVDTQALQDRIDFLETLVYKLMSGAGGQLPDANGRTRVAIESAPTAGITVGQASTAVWNVAVTGYPERALTNMPAHFLRNQIVVS